MISNQKQDEFEAAARPLIQWLNVNCHPHVTVIVENDGAQLFEGVCSFRTQEYIDTAVRRGVDPLGT